MRAFPRLLAAGYNPTPLPARGDAVEAWLKQQRDQHVDGYGPTPGWYALDRALNSYRLHAEYGTPLSQALNVDVPF